MFAEHLTGSPFAGRRLFVELWDITESLQPLCIKRNFDTPAGTQAHYQQGPTFVQGNVRIPVMPIPGAQQQTLYQAPIPVNMMSPTPYPYQASFMAQNAPEIQFAHMRQRQAMQQAAQNQQQMAALAYQQRYGGVTPAGLPVNIMQGAVSVEARAVFVQGLAYKANDKDVATHFSKVGKVVSCKVHRDGQTKKSKGNATVMYESAPDAQRAIQGLNGTIFMERTIQVRFDKDTTALATPPDRYAPAAPPLIVDGSRQR